MSSSSDEEKKKLLLPRRKPQKSPKNVYDWRQRFLLELEFAQCLSNPTYIHYLAQNRYFVDETFIGSLKYLLYWNRPEYVKFIMYPHCLYFLQLLQNPNFRSAMAHPGNKELAHRQQIFFWKNYRNNRLMHIEPRPLPEPFVAPPASATLPSSVPPLVPASALPVLSPMQYGVSAIRSSVADQRKRKYVGNFRPGKMRQIITFERKN